MKGAACPRNRTRARVRHESASCSMAMLDAPWRCVDLIGLASGTKATRAHGVDASVSSRSFAQVSRRHCPEVCASSPFLPQYLEGRQRSFGVGCAERVELCAPMARRQACCGKVSQNVRRVCSLGDTAGLVHHMCCSLPTSMSHVVPSPYTATSEWSVLFLVRSGMTRASRPHYSWRRGVHERAC